jgi:hypothetical protein
MVTITLKSHGELQTGKVLVPENMVVNVYTPKNCTLVDGGANSNLSKPFAKYESKDSMPNQMLEIYSSSEKYNYHDGVLPHSLRKGRNVLTPSDISFDGGTLIDRVTKTIRHDVGLKTFLNRIRSRYGGSITVNLYVCRANVGGQMWYDPKEKCLGFVNVHNLRNLQKNNRNKLAKNDPDVRRMWRIAQRRENFLAMARSTRKARSLATLYNKLDTAENQREICALMENDTQHHDTYVGALRYQVDEREKEIKRRLFHTWRKLPTSSR